MVPGPHGRRSGEALEPPHGDRIRITKESADAETRNPEFEKCFASHLRKILWLRGCFLLPASSFRCGTNFDAERIGEIDAAWREGDEWRGYASRAARVAVARPPEARQPLDVQVHQLAGTLMLVALRRRFRVQSRFRRHR